MEDQPETDKGTAPAESRPPRANTPTSTDTLVQRANAGDARAAMLLLVKRSAAEQPEAAPGIARVRLRPTKRFLLPKVPRRLADVEEKLREVFGELCAGERPWPLLIHGPAGVGKTCAALALGDISGARPYATLETACDDCMAGSAGRKWWTEPLRMAFPGDDEGAEIASERFCVPIILDELGERSKVGDLAYLTLKSILDWREHHHYRCAIYLSNLAPSEIASLFDDRIASRLTCGTVFKLGGKDRRLL